MRHLQRGGHVSMDTLARVIKEAAGLAKIPENLAHPHVLRHAAGYFLINTEHDVRLVQDFLGHRTPAMTAHYTGNGRPPANRSLDTSDYRGAWRLTPRIKLTEGTERSFGARS